MAASDEVSVGGYRCEFLDNPHEYLFCQLCKRVSRGATFITCCGENFCKGCITPVREAKQPCPICKAEEFSLNPNAKFDRQILNLRACCALKDRGCEWIGTVQDLDSHLSVEIGDCQFVDVTCPNKCGQPIPRCEVPNHLQNECPKREFFCQYCNFSGSHEVVCDQHYPECEYYPIPCPNGCSVVSIERGLLEDHLKMCPYQEVQCEYAHAGCQESFLREEMEKHMAENTQKHLALVSSVTAKLGQEFECRMGKMQEEFRGYLERREREVGEQLRQRDEQIAALEQRLTEKEEELRKSQQKMREELMTEIANEKRSCEERGERKEEEMKQQVRQVKKDMETKLEEREQQIQTLKQQLQSQEQKLQSQVTAATKKIKILEQQVQTCVNVKDFECRIETTETKLSRDFKEGIDARTAALEKKMERNNEHVQAQERQLQDQQSQVTATTKKVTILEQQVQTCGKNFEQQITTTKARLQHDFKKEIDARATALEKKRERDSEQRTREMNELNTKTRAELRRSIESKERKVEEMEKKVQILDNTLFPHKHHFMMFPYKQLKSTNSEWYSPPMYTHPGGYKFCVNVTPNGDSEGKGTHLSLYLVSLPGEFDDQLRWPVTISYTIQLLEKMGGAPVSFTTSMTTMKCRDVSIVHDGRRHFATHNVVESKHLKYDCLYFQSSFKVV